MLDRISFCMSAEIVTLESILKSPGIIFWIEILAKTVGIIVAAATGLWAYTKYVLERGLLPPTQFYVECERSGIQKNYKIIQISIHLHNMGSNTLVAKNIRFELKYLVKKNEINLYHDKQKLGRLIFPGSLLKDLKKEKSEPQIKSKESDGSSTEIKQKEITYNIKNFGKTELIKIIDWVAEVNKKINKTYKEEFITISDNKDQIIIRYNNEKEKLCIIKSIKAKENSKKIEREFPKELLEKIINPRGLNIMPHNTFVQPGVDQSYGFSTAVPIDTSFVHILASFEYELKPKFIQKKIYSLTRKLGLIHHSLSHISKPHNFEKVFNVE